MNQQLVDTVVHAVLYEGYILYPYRASAKKNRQRFTFGRVYPEAYSRAQNGAEPCSMQTECLVEGLPATTTLAAAVRFLHPIRRDIGELAVPLRAMPVADNPDFFHLVPELTVDGRHYASWQEAVERSVRLPALTLAELLERPREINFGFPAARTLEPIRNHCGSISGVIVREQEALSGTIELTADPVDAAVTKVSLRTVNLTPEPRNGFDDDAEEIVMRTFASTHTILHVRGGAFFSMIDPPETYAHAAALCRNLGSWPVLVGDEAAHERDTLVASPIILYDYPKIAAESPGDLFDAGEIDEILTLRIQTLTDDEKNEMRHVDARARAILERTEALPNADVLRMHGVMRAASGRNAVADAPEREHAVQVTTTTVQEEA
jgi:hydrogenase maturation protease